MLQLFSVSAASGPWSRSLFSPLGIERVMAKAVGLGLIAGKREKSKLRSQKGEVPPGTAPAQIEGWEPFAWKHNALRHSFISYRVAKIKNVNEVAMEAGNSPDLIFKHYRELVTEKEADAWFGVSPEAVAALKKNQEAEKAAKVVALAEVVAA
jgi:hypothetical protein